jgi:hypothetical protein
MRRYGGLYIPPAPPVMLLRSEDFSKSSPLRSTTYTRTAGFCLMDKS